MKDAEEEEKKVLRSMSKRRDAVWLPMCEESWIDSESASVSSATWRVKNAECLMEWMIALKSTTRSLAVGLTTAMATALVPRFNRHSDALRVMLCQ